MYVVKLHIQVRGTRRVIQEYIRAEYAPNVAEHADRFDTREQAENKADEIVEHFTAAGHKFIKAKFEKVG